MRRICVVVTARPSYARIRTVLEALERRGDVHVELVVAGPALLQKYGRVDTTARTDFPRIRCTEIYSTFEGDAHATMVQSSAHLASHLSAVLAHMKPDIVVTVADRYETLGTAMAASYMNIPLAHVQGGELTGSIDDKVRHAVTQLADLHFAATQQAHDHIIDMRLGMARHVYKVGCPSIDLAKRVLDSYAYAAFDPYVRYGGVGPLVDVTKPYVVLLHHPVTTHAETARTEMKAITSALDEIMLPAFVFWPNVDAGSDAISKYLRELREADSRPWHFFRHLDAEDFLALLLHAQCLIGNSSVGIRECSYLAVPVVNIGDRQQGRERGPNVIDVPADMRAIVEAIQLCGTRDLTRFGAPLYGDGAAGERIAQLLATVSL